jgi:hypothetical protein
MYYVVLLYYIIMLYIMLQNQILSAAFKVHRTCKYFIDLYESVTN